MKVQQCYIHKIIPLALNALKEPGPTQQQHNTAIICFFVFQTGSTSISVFVFAPLSLVGVQGKWQQANLRGGGVT